MIHLRHVAGSCEHGNERSDPIKGRPFLTSERLLLFKKDSGLWSLLDL